MVLSPLAAAQSIGFEEFAGDGNPEFGTFVTGGYEFTAFHAHVISDFDLPVQPVAENGSLVYLASEGSGTGTPITIRRADGRPFGLPYFDAAELWTSVSSGFPNATSIQLTITNVDGSTQAETYSLDGVVDGAGGNPDFQTIVRPASFELMSVVFSGKGPSFGDYAFAIDDIAVRPTWLVAGTGTAGSAGVPVLFAMGTLAAGGAGELRLASALPSCAGLLLASVAPSPLPFKGGTLQAFPVAAALPFATDASGGLKLAWHDAPGVPVVPQLVLQAALLDPGAVGGVSLSDAVVADLVGLPPGGELIATGSSPPGDPIDVPPAGP